MKNIDLNSIIDDLAVSEQQLLEGKTKDARTALEELRKKYGLDTLQNTEGVHYDKNTL